MNAVEIEEAVSNLIEQDFDPVEFPFAFLEAYGNKETTLKRLRSGNTNKSDVEGGVLQTNNVHILACKEGGVAAAMAALRGSKATTKAKVKLLLATDGQEVQAENLKSGDTLACHYHEFPEHFLFFAALAGISFTKSIENPELDVRATGRLNRLYVELLKQNPEWSTPERRHDMNQFMARMIFCFFAEDTDIFNGDDLFTATIEQMSDSKSGNTHEVIGELFRAMDTPIKDRAAGKFRPWADAFPYVNGGLFAGTRDVPEFNSMARTYLLNAGKLDWQKINPDIFGSMIQAVTDEEERDSLGMHYTSVENILKLLNPLFLDDLHEKLEEAGSNERKLLNLRKRMSKIRVFDPACGSGNFLVIAYKQMREIEYEINKRRGEDHLRSEIPIRNFCGIELRDFPAEIARLALIIAEFQCDVTYRGQKDALAEFLPLNEMNWIVKGNALRIDWLSVCPPTGKKIKPRGDDLFSTPLDQPEIDFENEGGETYICGNPPYLGKGKKDAMQLADMELIFSPITKKYGYVDYVGCWLVKAAEYCRATPAAASLVATNSISQGRQLPQLWPHILTGSIELFYCHHSFKWSNNASHNAGVICVIVGIAPIGMKKKKTIENSMFSKDAVSINPYLVAAEKVIIESRPQPLSGVLSLMQTGSVPNDGGNLIMSPNEKRKFVESNKRQSKFIHTFCGSEDFIKGHSRYCFVISDKDLSLASKAETLRKRLLQVKALREQSKKKETREKLAQHPHRFQHRGPIPTERAIIIPQVSSERREWFPVGVLEPRTVVSNLAFLLNDAPLWQMSILASKLHLIWLATVCGKLKNDFRYSNTLGWNTFPVPKFTEKNKADLTKCAEDILLARESHFPATIADLYDPDAMPGDLRQAHERNDEVLERIYIGRRFKNDTERLEKLFDLYTKMTSSEAQISAKGA